MINDSIFGEIEYDYIWSRNSKINFLNKEVDIMLIIAGEDDGKFEGGQYEAYQVLINYWNSIQKTLLKPILDYYKERRKELGYDIEFNEYYPEINSTKELLNYITLVGIKVPYANIYGGRSIGISFDCTWDEENGVGVRLNNEQVIEVGYQDIAI
ncbi:DUF6985 domain-containing protein [Clostridium felsineum]|uniref:DUF6985 domain-containing protein n=1 Tax=Clostridium felsineum TaxID=36839 RepID=A0A1S8KXZ8_9CLOT|nr:DUF2004 domain-containing protein [Clostridium felsineum]URZ08133.1 hypothetical protein CLROS_034990 [Clostridium felsineum]URZ13164.1 hypothetical protein CROST_039140 [Clostridium felsineum]